MSTIRKHGQKWQSIVRIHGHPSLAKSFISKTDATRWANQTEVKLRREDTAKIAFGEYDNLSYLNSFFDPKHLKNKKNK